MKNTLLRAAIAALFAATALAACDRDTEQKLDSAAARTEAKLAEIGHKTSEGLTRAGEQVKPVLENAGEKTRAALNEASGKVEAKTAEMKANDAAPKDAAAVEAKPAAPPADSSRGMSDTAITASIKTDYLKDPDLSVLKIDVDTHGGVVTLNGLANDEAARSRAEKLAGAIKGVREVRNFLVVKRA